MRGPRYPPRFVSRSLRSRSRRSEGAFRAGVNVQPATRLPVCSHVDVSGISQVPRRSILCLASVHDPGRTDDPSPIDGFIDAAPTRTTVKASASWLFRGYRGASALAAYASRMVLPPPMQSSLPAGWLAFTGRESNPLDRYKRFQITFSFPSSGFILAQRTAGFPQYGWKAGFPGSAFPDRAAA